MSWIVPDNFRNVLGQSIIETAPFGTDLFGNILEYPEVSGCFISIRIFGPGQGQNQETYKLQSPAFS
jgi:hypothetical protein